MIVKIGEVVYTVQWKHTEYLFNKIKCGKTRCIIKEDAIYCTSAIAECSRRDQFNKNTGRKVSLKRAIKDFKQSNRRKFWEAYAEMRNGNF